MAEKAGAARTSEVARNADAPAEPTPLYLHSLFSRGVLQRWRDLLTTLWLPVLYDMLLMLGCLSLYWSTLQYNNVLNGLSVTVVDLDGGFLGTRVVDGLRAVANGAPGTLAWTIDDSITSDAESRQRVVDERTWAVLQGATLPTGRQRLEWKLINDVVSPNVSTALADALAIGNASYNPLDAVTLYYASGRQQMTVLSAIVPNVGATLAPILSGAGAASVARFLAAAQNNGAALNAAQQCPQCLASPFAVRQVDLVPFSSPMAVGSVTIGLIFVSPPHPRAGP